MKVKIRRSRLKKKRLSGFLSRRRRAGGKKVHVRRSQRK